METQMSIYEVSWEEESGSVPGLMTNMVVEVEASSAQEAAAKTSKEYDVPQRYLTVRKTA